MTILASPEMVNVRIGEINWQIVDTVTPGGCSTVEWCEGQHPQAPYRGVEKVRHVRSIGSAMRDDTWDAELLVEVVVAQWKATTEWIVGGSGGCYPNRDKAPEVGVFTYPTNGPEQGMWLSDPWGAPLEAVLRQTGDTPFADLLAAAIQFAHKLDEETKR